MPDIDTLFIADLLQKMEVYVEAVHGELGKEEREHVAGTLGILRNHYDSQVEALLKQATLNRLIVEAKEAKNGN